MRDVACNVSTYLFIFNCCKITKMNNTRRLFNLYKESPLYQLFVSLMTIIGVGMTLSVILVMAGKLIFSSDLSVLDKASDALSKKDLGFMRYILISQDISLLIIPSIIIMLLMRP